MDSILDLIKRLSDHDVQFVLVGGLAAVAFGSPLVTQDVDVAAPLDEDNARRILEAIADLSPQHRLTPGRKPLTETPAELAGFENLYLLTSLGQLDILGHITGIGSFEKVLAESVEIDLGERTVRALSPAGLIRSKQALGREKDKAVIVHLKAILERMKDQESDS